MVKREKKENFETIESINVLIYIYKNEYLFVLYARLNAELIQLKLNIVIAHISPRALVQF